VRGKQGEDGRSGLQTGLLWAAIIAAAWAMLSPLLLFLPVYDEVVMGEQVSRSAFGAGQVGAAMAVIGPAIAAGVIGVIGTRLVFGGLSNARLAIGLAALVLLLLSVLSATSLGPFLFPPAFLFFFPALWLGEE